MTKGNERNAMSDVTLTIGGRRYKLACAAGEEAHVARLGEAVDARIAALPGSTRQSEVQTLLYASLLLADELHAGEDRADQPVDQPAPDDMASADPLEELADRLEKLAETLERSAASP